MIAEPALQVSIVAADVPLTQRGLKSRHAQMIALGGTIGTGLFIGSGQTLALGGPAFTLVSYIIITILIYFIVTVITQVATYLPVHGGTMSCYGYRYVSKSMGFAMGYLYWYALGILVPYEAKHAWHPSSFHDTNKPPKSPLLAWSSTTGTATSTS